VSVWRPALGVETKHAKRHFKPCAGVLAIEMETGLSETVQEEIEGEGEFLPIGFFTWGSVLIVVLRGQHGFTNQDRHLLRVCRRRALAPAAEEQPEPYNGSRGDGCHRGQVCQSGEE
jgi:hypothetical protein